MALTKEKPAETPDLYETDFHAWAVAQAAALLDRNTHDLDWTNLAEEIETLGRSERREIESRLSVLLTHLLKARYQPEKWKGGWQATIKLERRKLAKALRENPSLRRFPEEVLGEVYGDARLNAALQTGLGEQAFPEACPFAIEDVLDPEFFAGRTPE